MTSISTPEGRRRLIQNSISNDDWQNETRQTLLTRMRERGLGIGNEAFSALRNNTRQAIQNMKTANQLKPNEIIPLGLMDKDHFSTIGDNFKYTVTFTGIDTKEGIERQINRSVASNIPLTREQVLNDANLALNPKLYDDAQFFLVTDQELTEGKINKTLDLSTL